MRPLTVLAVTRDPRAACGISDYYNQLVEASAGLPVEFICDGQWLTPQVFFDDLREAPPHDLVWLNHHAGLHSQWTADHLRQLRALRIPVVVTLHDTRAGGEIAPNLPQLLELYAVADATIVHEPCTDMPTAIWIRQGVPGAQYPVEYGAGDVTHDPASFSFKAFARQPVLGTVGFNFPWKGFDGLARLTGELGWALVILSNDADADSVARWIGLNPHTQVITGFLSREEIVSRLAGCDATAFCYDTANNGTSGAIRLGLAARKPLYAFDGCRQFRDLQIAELDEGSTYIRWTQNFETLGRRLREEAFPGVDTGICWVAHRDRWPLQAQRYLQVFQQAVQAPSGG